jgi:DNA polymerase III sliding clamp (beta) subunit (PCNA family)
MRREARGTKGKEIRSYLVRIHFQLESNTLFSLAGHRLWILIPLHNMIFNL